MLHNLTTHIALVLVLAVMALPGRVLSASHRAQEAAAVGEALGATPGYRASRNATRRPVP